MASKNTSVLPPPRPEQRRAAAGQFERANQVIATGNYDYGIRLLLSCCKLDPANLIYRQTLRRTEKTKYKNNLRGSHLAWLTTWTTRARIKTAQQSGDYLKVLEQCEELLTRNPWDLGAQMDMAEAAETLGLVDLAVWTLEQARQKHSLDVCLNRTLAQLYEKRGNFTQAVALWQVVRKADPSDADAARKINDLAATETIARTVGGKEKGGGEKGRKGETQKMEDGGSKIEDSKIHPPSSILHPPSSILPPSPVDRLSREVAALQARIEADPTDAKLYLQLAGLHRRNRQLEQARAVLQKGLGPTGNDFDIATELADLDIEPYRRDLGITEEKLRGQPEDEELRKIRVGLMREINSRELDLFRNKADRHPTDKASRYELGLRLYRAGQFDEAIRELQAVRDDPRLQWRSLMYLGHCFKGRNNWRLAQRNFEEALQNMPTAEKDSRKETLFQLAKGSADNGDLARAVDIAHELANEDFSYRDIGRLLDEWQAKLQQS